MSEPGEARWYHRPRLFLERFSQRKSGPAVLGACAVGESSVFPLPVNWILAGLVLAHPKRWALFALSATLGSLLGAALGYLLGAFLWRELSGYFFEYAIDPASFDV